MQTPEEKIAIQNAAESKIFHFRPVFFTAIFLIFGIVYAYARVRYGVSLWWTLLFVPFISITLLFSGITKRVHVILCAFLLVLAVLVGLFSFTQQVQNYVSCGKYQGEYAVVGLVSEKTRTQYGGSVFITEVYVDGTREDGKLVAYLPASFVENVRLGDRVVLRGSLDTQTNIFTENAFATYTFSEDIRFIMRADECVVTKHEFYLFYAVRERVERALYAGMDETSAAVTMALLTGNSSGIESGLLENIRRGGISHIFAVSGLHIGVLYAFCLFLTKKTALCKTPKLFRFFFTCGILLFYGGVCGFSCSVIRAIVMCLIAYAASLLGIGLDRLELLAMAAIVVLLINAAALFTVGFALSFTACLGILLLARPIAKVTNKALSRVVAPFKTEAAKALAQSKDNRPPTIREEIKRGCVSFFSASLAAQASTAPVLLSAFGYVSGWALLLNGLFVPLISGIFALLLCMVVLACVLPLAASGFILATPSVVISTLMLLFETVDFSTFCLQGFSLGIGGCFCYYLCLTAATDTYNFGKRLRALLVLIGVLGFALCVFGANT